MSNQPNNGDSKFDTCCHCGCDIVDAHEAVIIKETDPKIIGDDKTTQYVLCRNCHDHMRNLEKEVEKDLNFFDTYHNRTELGLYIWRHMFLNEAEFKRELNAK